MSNCVQRLLIQNVGWYMVLMWLWLDSLPRRRGCARRQLHQAPPYRTMLSHLCCLMNVEVTLFAFIFSWVFLVFLSHAHIRGVPVSDIWYDPFFAHDHNTAFAIAVCDLLRPGVDQPYHTPLYSWSCLYELLLQSSSNRTFQIPVICFPVFASKSKFQSCKLHNTLSTTEVVTDCPNSVFVSVYDTSLNVWFTKWRSFDARIKRCSQAAYCSLFLTEDVKTK